MLQIHPQAATFTEPARTLPVLAHADVLVLGGGPGGIGAAIAAARNGARTILVERFGTLGGTWTSGLLSSIMPFPFVKGIFLEIIQNLDTAGAWRRSEREDPYDIGPQAHPDPGPYGHGGTYDAETLKRVLDQMVLGEGVIPYFFLQVVSVFRAGDRLTGVVVESKEGRFVITADFFIDSSGDGDVCHMAGVPTEYGRDTDANVQPMTMMFKMDGVDDSRAEAYSLTDPRLLQVWQAAKRAGEVTVPRENVLLSRSPYPGQWVFNTTRILGKNGTRIQDVTEAMIEGRRQVHEVAAFLKKNVPGFEQARVSETASHVGVRETRRVFCDYTMTADDITAGAEFHDGIARGNWYIDIHNPSGEGTTVQSPPAGRFYEIPFRSLRPRGVENLLVASRCIDCTHEAHAAVRITPQVVAIGQAAGTAAALCHREALTSIRSLDSTLLRLHLRDQKAFI
jgi:hypothetical protein